MSKKRRQHSPAVKAQIGLEALKNIEPVHAIAARHGVHPTQASQPERTYLFSGDMPDEEVARVIRAQIPELENGAIPQLERMSLIREWISSFVPVAAGPTLELGAALGIDHHQATTAQMLAYGERGMAGMFCGGFAELARRVFVLLDFPAIWINFGDPHSFATHVITLVRHFDEEGKELWIIQDTYFNFTVMDQSGAPIGFQPMLDRISAGQVDTLQISQSKVRSVLLARTRLMDLDFDLSPTFVEKQGDAMRYSIDWNFQRVLSASGYRDFLIRNTGSENPLGIFMFLINCSGEAIALELVAYAERANIRFRSSNSKRLQLTQEHQ